MKLNFKANYWRSERNYASALVLSYRFQMNYNTPVIGSYQFYNYIKHTFCCTHLNLNRCFLAGLLPVEKISLITRLFAIIEYFPFYTSLWILSKNLIIFCWILPIKAGICRIFPKGSYREKWLRPEGMAEQLRQMLAHLRSGLFILFRKGNLSWQNGFPI